jgi:prepilin-type N-terminal cleavage/methylation domain-containing protein
MKIIRGRSRQSRELPLRSGQAGRRGRLGFTLVEILIAMAVSGIILASVASLAWALSSYNYQGEAAVELATHGRHALLQVCRDIRAARALGVSGDGALVLWMGDYADDRIMSVNEFIIYYQGADSTQARRLSFGSTTLVGNLGSTAFQQMLYLFDHYNLPAVAQAWGLSPTDVAVCGHCESLTFYPNRAVPQTLTVEVVLRLSRAENMIEGTGDTIALNLYAAGTMRIPYEDDGFDPQF